MKFVKILHWICIFHMLFTNGLANQSPQSSPNKRISIFQNDTTDTTDTAPKPEFGDIDRNAATEDIEKIDLTFVIDTSDKMSTDNLIRFIRVLSKLLKHFSISPGTTRVALYTVSDSFKKHFSFRDNVNRESLIKSIKSLVFKLNKRNRDFGEMLRTGFQKIKNEHSDIEGQRRVNLYITNNIGDVDIIKKKLGFHQLVEFYVLLFKDENNNLEADDMKNQARQGNTFSSNKVSIIHFPTSVKQILSKMKVKNKQYGVCVEEEDGNEVMDECDRRCKCVSGKLTDCYRLRKEISSMSSSERRRYLKAYKTLTTTSPYKEVYERFVFMHYKYFCWGIHNRDLFLPWHRWFLVEMENLLREIDCGVTIPYWDWSYVSHDPWNRKNLWRSTDDGIGSNGNRFKGYCVQKGIFRESEWTTPYWEDPMDIILSSADQLDGDIEDQRGHLAFCLRRAFKGHTPSYESVQRTLLLPARKFKDFDIQMRHNFHDRVHNVIGGTMSTHYAADTPEFFLHHSFLDKIWYTWQLKSWDHKWVHFLQRNTTKMMGTDYTHYEYTDSLNLPRFIKIKYKGFPKKERLKRSIDIDSMSRMPNKYWEKYLDESWYGTFPNCTRTKPEKKRANYLHKLLDGPGPIIPIIP